MCLSGFLYFLTETTVHLEKKKESFMTFVPVSSNGNPLTFSQPQLQEIQIPATPANQSVVLYTFLRRDAIRLSSLFPPCRIKI